MKEHKCVGSRTGATLIDFESRFMDYLYDSPVGDSWRECGYDPSMESYFESLSSIEQFYHLIKFKEGQ